MHRVEDSRTRIQGYRFRVRWERFTMNLSGNLFTQRAVGIYGTSCKRRCCSRYCKLFKSHLGRCMKRKGLEGYGPNVGRW